MLASQAKWINTWLVAQFAAWRAGGADMATAVAANLHSTALMFAAVESSRTGAAIDIPAFIRCF